MVEIQTWRDLLALVISESQERRRIAEELGINPITLVRWSNGKSNPRPENLRALFVALPQHQVQLAKLIVKEFPIFQNMPTSGGNRSEASGIPASFYASVMTTYTSSPQHLRGEAVRAQIVQQMLAQLDPQQHGMAVMVIRCMRPVSGQKVHSLRQVSIHVSRSWSNLQEVRACFFGAESQSGYAVATGHPVIIPNQQEKERLFPMHKMDRAESYLTIPILLSDRIAGCLTIWSPHAHYFTQEILSLIQDYANLLVLSFELHEFYDLPQIELGLMPEYTRQVPLLSTFQQRVTRRMIQATQEQQPLTRPEAELAAWHELETELLRLASMPPE